MEQGTSLHIQDARGANLKRHAMPTVRAPRLSGSHPWKLQAQGNERALNIARHDKAMRQVIKEIMKGHLGSHYIIADVGHLEGLRQLGVHSKGIPEFVLPNEFLPQTGMEPDLAVDTNKSRDKLRPDVMIVETTIAEGLRQSNSFETTPLPPQMPDGKPRRVWIVEGGYCADTRYEGKLQEKEQQHKRLQKVVTAYGYKVTCCLLYSGFMDQSSRQQCKQFSS